MKRTNGHVMTATALAAAVLLTATDASAQDSTTEADWARHDAAAEAVNEAYQARLDRAAALEGLAQEASMDLRTFDEAADLYRQAAEVRGDSPESVDNLIASAQLSFYLGDEGEAVGTLTRAGEAARSWDDVATAADAFLDAAWVAQDQGWTRRAISLAQEAEKLSHSTLMTQQDRTEIRERIADLQE